MTLKVTDRCPRCKGALRVDEDDLACMNCGFRAQAPGTNGASPDGHDQGVEIVVTFRPRDIPELIAAWGKAEGHLTGAQWLQSKGVSAYLSREIMKGALLHVDTLQAIVEGAAITSKDFLSLFKATRPEAPAAQPAQTGLGSNSTYMTCPNPQCGKRIGKKAKTCRYCGTTINQGRLSMLGDMAAAPRLFDVAGAPAAPILLARIVHHVQKKALEKAPEETYPTGRLS